MYKTGDWIWNTEHNQICKVIEVIDLWGQINYRVWLPEKDAVIKVNADKLSFVSNEYIGNPHRITYLANAARIADTLSQDILLAPVESSVIPLPHQIHALSRAITNDKVRYLLADEVGLGKTIEAGLIMRELKLRGLAKRILVVAPKGLITQWVAEMKTHFNEDFKLIIPGDFNVFRRFTDEENLWKVHNQVVCPIDSIKPIEERKGWSRERLAEYNKERYEDLITAGWDLIVIDEAHRLGGSTEQVARYKLGKGLSEASPYLLLLSATPHQGKSDAFHRLIALLDNNAFPTIDSLDKERVREYVIRTEKKNAKDAEGNPLFKPRNTKLIPVHWDDNHQPQKMLYEAVTDYVREGYNQAMLEKKAYIGFLMILLQRLVTSSTRAIRTTLERRLEVLTEPGEQLDLFSSIDIEEWEDMDGQEQLENFLTAKIKALKNEQEEVKTLLEAAKRIEASGPDVKAEKLLEIIYKLQQKENDPNLKLLIFTEFVPTQQMLYEFLTDRGISCVCLNGSMDFDQRRIAQKQFAGDTRVLISTDAGGEGINLQFCHVVVNYDIPWNPMKLEQRIGRVDRIGQNHIVKVNNFLFEETIEYRVREVLEQKLMIILEEFGVDKTGDILDSAEAGKIFDDIYIRTILNPDEVENEVETKLDELKGKMEAEKESKSILGTETKINSEITQKIISHPISYWIEQMSVNYLKANKGAVIKNGDIYELHWPAGDKDYDVVFSSKKYEEMPHTNYISLEHSKIRGLAMQLPRFTSGQPIPCIYIPDISNDIKGYWSLWKIEILSEDLKQRKIMPLFINDDARILPQTANHMWDKLQINHYKSDRFVDSKESYNVGNRITDTALSQAKSIYDELSLKHKQMLEREYEKGKHSFEARRKVLERVGLPGVRSFRLKQLEEEEIEWKASLDKRKEIIPEIFPIILLRIEGGKDG